MGRWHTKVLSPGVAVVDAVVVAAAGAAVGAVAVVSWPILPPLSLMAAKEATVSVWVGFHVECAPRGSPYPPHLKVQ